MEYREIVAVTGIGGLFQLMATKSDGAIVRSLADKSTRFISARLHNVTPLESIEIYTTGDNVRLHDVFQKMKDSTGTPLPEAKNDNNAVKAYFQSVFPEFDEERVYVSDMKKMVKWFELLKENDLLNFEAMAAPAEEEAPAEAETVSPEASAEADDADKAAKKPRAKKSADTEAAAEAEARPKKVARKKKADEESVEAGGEEKAPKKTAKKKKEEE